MMPDHQVDARVDRLLRPALLLAAMREAVLDAGMQAEHNRRTALLLLKRGDERRQILHVALEHVGDIAQHGDADAVLFKDEGVVVERIPHARRSERRHGALPARLTEIVDVVVAQRRQLHA